MLIQRDIMNTESQSTIVLVTNCFDKVLELRNFQHFSDGPGFSAEMFVRCNGFSAQRPFYWSKDSFHAAIESLRGMDEHMNGKARFEEVYEHAQFLELSMRAHGHVLVSGQLVFLGEYLNRLSFAFETDQTCLAPLIRSLDTFNHELGTS